VRAGVVSQGYRSSENIVALVPELPEDTSLSWW